jgi:hypothetical protein
MTKTFRFQFALLAVLLIPRAAAAQALPQLRDVPDILPAESREHLRSLRTQLASQRESLKEVAAKFNVRCASVPRSSEASSQCNQDLASLKSKKDAHIRESQKFNLAVSNAICQMIDKAKNQWDTLSQKLAWDKERIKSLGFEADVEALEKYQSLKSFEQAVFERRTEQMVKGVLINAALDRLQAHVRSAAENAEQMIAENAGKMINTLAEDGLNEDNTPEILQSLRQISDSKSQADRANAANRFISVVRQGTRIAKTAPLDTSEKWINAMFIALGWATDIVPQAREAKPFLPVAKWLVLIAYDNITFYSSLDHLLRDTDLGLQELKNRTEQFRIHLAEFTEVKKILQNYQCSSVDFVLPPKFFPSSISP